MCIPAEHVLGCGTGLTTQNGYIIDSAGSPVHIKGVAISGFETVNGKQINGNPTEGTDSINQDYRTTIYRCALVVRFSHGQLVCGQQASDGTVQAAKGQSGSQRIASCECYLQSLQTP